MAGKPEKKSRGISSISDRDILDAMKDIQGYLDITPEDMRALYSRAYSHAEERIARSARAGDIMTRDVLTVGPDTPVDEVAAEMARRGVSGVPVVETGGRVAGIISEKDFLHRMAGEVTESFMAVVARCLAEKGCVAVPIKEKLARDIMSAPAVTVGEETSLGEIAETLSRRSINRVPVVDAEGRLLGIVSRDDVLEGMRVREGG